MLLTLEEYEPAWKALRRQVMSHSVSKLAVFVSCVDVDAVCAAKMLVQLLQKDLILHRVLPVIGRSSLDAGFKSLEDDITNVVLVGCGANLDIEELVGEELLDRLKVHIIDNHRPWNLENLYGSDRILCFDDGSSTDLDQYKQAWEFLAANAEEPDSDQEDEVYGYKQNRESSERHSASELLVQYMNHGTHLSSTNTVQVYTLLTLLGETNKRNLWLMITGVCSLETLYPEIYLTMFPVIRDEVTRLNDSAGVAISSKELSLTIEQDFALFLLRDWSFYDSLSHSPYISSKFKLWTEVGRNKLKKMLAQMGVALQQAKQKWAFMDQTVKRELKERLTEVMTLYGIEDVLRDGVIRRFGYSGTISASDCAESLAAMLEYHTVDPSLDKSDHDDMFWSENFWDAWRSIEDLSCLKEGMKKAQTLQRVVVASTYVAFEKGQPKNLRYFRLVVIQDGNELEVLSNPLTLQRLAIWIDGGGSSSQATSHLPLVIAAYNEHKGAYCVLGAAPRRKRDEVSSTSGPVKNKFGAMFHRVALEINADVAIDAFDSSVIQVARDDLPRFLEHLHTQLKH